MYLEFYGLKKRPFDMTPDPAFFFPSQKHTEALASLIYAVKEKRGFVVITGEIGSGKTTVCRTLLQRLDPAAKAAVITNTTLTAKQLLETICDQFGLITHRQNKVALVGELNRFLTEHNEAGNTVVLILDEAQDLSVKALEEIRLISNIETNTQKLVQIMLLGQPELREKLNRPDLEQLRQRISLRYHLSSLSREETRRYVEHRLSVAGDQGRVKFTKGATDSLYEFSKGVPRLINVVCDQALLMGYLRETRRIDEKIVREIAAEFSFSAEEQASGYAEEKQTSFWSFLRRKRSPRSERHQAAASAPTPPGTEQTDDESGGAPLLREDEVLGKLADLKLAGIWAENGCFVAALDGVHLKRGDHFFGMEVAEVDEGKVVFQFGEKRYQLAIESSMSSDDGSMSPTGLVATDGSEKGAADA